MWLDYSKIEKGGDFTLLLFNVYAIPD